MTNCGAILDISLSIYHQEHRVTFSNPPDTQRRPYEATMAVSHPETSRAVYQADLCIANLHRHSHAND